jgi:signal peptidase I
MMLARPWESLDRLRSAAVVRPGRIRTWAGSGLCLVMAAQLCPLRPGVVVGRSMEPTLAPGSLFLYDHSYYRDHPLRAGDVVLIRHGGTTWVKRIFAVEGESFWTLRRRLEDGRFRRDPVARGHESRFARLAENERSHHRTDVYTVRLRVPPSRVFVVGDGALSLDSRSFGPLDRADVIGRVVALPGQRLAVPPDQVALAFPTAGRHLAERVTPTAPMP